MPITKRRRRTAILLGASVLVACTPGPAETSPGRPGGDRASAPTANRTARAGPGAQASPVPSSRPVPVSAAWSRVTVPKTAFGAQLLDITATGPREAWAAGVEDAGENRPGDPVALRWDGIRWHRMPSLDVPHDENDFSFETVNSLDGVGASGPDDVWVTGGGGSRAFAAHWDGHRWRKERPFGVSHDHFLFDVETAGRKAWFAGSGPSGPMIVRWDGHRFTEPEDLGERGDRGMLRDIAVRDGHLWAVGGTESDASATGNPLVYHRPPDDSLYAEPSVLKEYRGRLDGVWPVSKTDVWAVGLSYPEPGGDGERPLIVRWDGSRWNRVDPPFSRGVLRSVTATGPDDVWFAGVDADHPRQPLFLHFDGAGWSREYGPPSHPYRDGGHPAREELHPVWNVRLIRVPGTTELWAAGSSEEGGYGEGKPFVLRRRPVS
ncbi:hypothetical protein AB0D67_18530 [Streptosporangium sp. NPDC048047]|uniref:hypothetical protein n=1 Tax=Streptosporangium sp. NPDC048047 TaxID=3155748 RepID=UPI0034289474